MNNRLLKFLPIAAALLMAVSCSRDDDGNAPASGRDGVHTVSTTTDITKNVSIPFAITVGGKPSSLTKAKVEDKNGGLTQKFSDGDVLIITGDGLDKGNPSVLTITPEGIDQETATFTGNLNLASEGALESGAKLTATLANKTLGNQGQPLAAPVLVSDLEEAFEKYGYLVADFTYDAGATSINLEQHTAFLVFDLPYTGEKVNVKIGDVTTQVFVSSKQVLAVPDGATVTSQRMSIDLTIDLLLETSGEAVDVVFDIKRDLQLPDACVPGLFSVSADKQVFFSKGNLQYNPTQDKWRFAPTQYDKCFSDGDHNSTSGYITTDHAGWTGHDGWIDLFGWGTWTKNGTEDPNSTNNNFSEYTTGVGTDGGDFENVCTSDIIKALGTGWTTLSHDEWIYLLGDDHNKDATCRNNNNAKSLRATKEVDGILGLVILPDGSTADIENTVWETLESAGAVFLPAAGDRFGTAVYDVGSGGYYWSSTASAYSAYYLYFRSGYVSPDDASYRYFGQSVRLVRPLK